MVWRTTLLCLLLTLPDLLWGYGEPDASGRPVYQERANHVFMNAVRIAPAQYKSVYMSGYSPSPASILTSYPAVPPVYLEPKLCASAYYHSNDMATNKCFSHASCDGTDPFVRIGNYYKCSGFMAENIAAGYADPLVTNNQWLCDAVGSACAADKSANDGHRMNIMSSQYTAVGVGYAFQSSATYRYYWTQDFGGAPCSPVPTSPIYGGSHYISESNTKFIAVYYKSPAAAPTSASVVIGGTSYTLTLDIGAEGQGTYAVTRPKGPGCQSYYFSIGGARYPETGCLVTYGEGTCTQSFDASCPGAAGAASAAAAAATSASVSGATSASPSGTTKSATSSPAGTTTTKNSLATTGTTGGGGGTTTGNGGTYYLYSSGLQRDWTVLSNQGALVATNAQYSSRTCIKASLTSTSSPYTNFFLFNHSPAIKNQYTTLRFYAAAAASGSIYVYFNGYTAQMKSVTTAWQLYTIPLSLLRAPSTLGNPAQLVFQNTGPAAMTLYLDGVAFV